MKFEAVMCKNMETLKDYENFCNKHDLLGFEREFLMSGQIYAIRKLTKKFTSIGFLKHFEYIKQRINQLSILPKMDGVIWNDTASTFPDCDD